MTATYRQSTASAVRELARTSPLATLTALAGDWGLIAASVAVGAVYGGHPTVYAACCLVIAARQHALAVLMHEGAHGHLFRRPFWNDLVADVFTAWPLGLSVARYREHHWKHHQFTNTERDPDWGRKVTVPAWQFPKTRARFFRDFFPYLYGLGVRELVFAVKVIGVDRASLPRALVFYGVVAAALTLSGGWILWAKFWLVPYLALLPVLMKIRSIAEHLGLPNRNELDASRNIVSSPMEAFFLGPHSNSLHLIHHLFPQVPWHRLRRLRAALREDESFRAGAHENTGYFLPGKLSVFNDLIGTGAKKEESRAA